MNFKQADQPAYRHQRDGETSHDFCYFENAIQANLLAATSSEPGAVNQIFNVAVGDRTPINELYATLKTSLTQSFPHLSAATPMHQDFRAGDVRHSLADIGKGQAYL
ncbi:MAG: hypothetical protein H7203_11095 [Rhizobacter sp.]|nr:hypothetical protein [Burkholderiales bacterium]